MIAAGNACDGVPAGTDGDEALWCEPCGRVGHSFGIE